PSFIIVEMILNLIIVQAALELAYFVLAVDDTEVMPSNATCLAIFPISSSMHQAQSLRVQSVKPNCCRCLKQLELTRGFIQW
ncbi:hypothetical protein PanWU01x14_041340, partial [Parasponia andersonii]